MPCRSDYMEQTNSEKRFQETTELLVWVMHSLHMTPPYKYVTNNTYYSKNVGQVEALCEFLRNLKDTPAFDRIVYNARDPMSRRLATWWEEHEAEDQKRERAEANEIADVAIFAKLTSNLTDDQKRILKKYL